MTSFATDAAIEHIALGVIDRTLPKTDWTHAAHFAAAVWLLRYRPDLTTASRDWTPPDLAPLPF